MKTRIYIFLFVLSACINLYAIEFTIPRLTPLPTEISKNKISLAGDWKFTPFAKDKFWLESNLNDWKNIEVPGE